ACRLAAERAAHYYWVKGARRYLGGTVIQRSRWRPAAAAQALILALALSACRAEPPPPASSSAGAAAATAAAPAAPVAATPAPRIALRIGYSSVDASQTPLWVAQDAGILAANGIDA